MGLVLIAIERGVKSDVIVVTSFMRTPLLYGHFAQSLRCPY